MHETGAERWWVFSGWPKGICGPNPEPHLCFIPGDSVSPRTHDPAADKDVPRMFGGQFFFSPGVTDPRGVAFTLFKRGPIRSSIKSYFVSGAHFRCLDAAC